MLVGHDWLAWLRPLILACSLLWCRAGWAAPDLTVPPPSSAHPPVTSKPPPLPAGAATVTYPQLSYDLRIDVPLVVVGYAAWNTLQALNEQLARNRCRWCDDDLNDVDESFRRWLRWESGRDTALLLSDIFANAISPAASIGMVAILAGRDDRFSGVPVDIVIVGEAAALAGVLTQLVKYYSGRIRPDARALPPEERPVGGGGKDAYVSFYSGHTSYAFSLAVSAGTIASLRQYRGAGWVWVGGLSVATATAYFRIAGDKHYFTDTLAAAAVSSAVGFSVPYFFHRPVRYVVPLRPGVLPVERGALLTLNSEF